MPRKFDDYNPAIPLNDDITEESAPEPQIPEPEKQPEPRRRKRVRQRAPQDMPSGKATQAEMKSKTSDKPTSTKSWGDQIKEWAASPVTRMSIGIVLGGLGVWLAIAFSSYLVTCIQDQSAVMDHMNSGEKIANQSGRGGAYLSNLLINEGFGIGAFVIVVWLIGMSLKQLLGYPRFKSLNFTLKCLVAFITLSVVTGMLSIGLDTPVNWGGFHGRYVNEIVYDLVGPAGGAILSIVLVCLFVVICLRDLVNWIIRKKKAYDAKRQQMREAAEAELRKQQEIEEMAERERRDQAASGEGISIEADKVADTQGNSVDFDPDTDIILDISETEEEPLRQVQPDDELILSEEDSTEEMDMASEKSNDTEVLEISDSFANSDNTSNSNSDNSQDSMKTDDSDDSHSIDGSESTPPTGIGPMTVNVNQIEKGNEDVMKGTEDNLFTHEYKFPPTDYMRPGTDKISVDPDELLENKEKIRKTLLDFGIPIISIEATVGPTVTLYEIRPDAGVKIAKIRNLADDIALQLSAIGVRIIAPIPGKGTVGIEVANKDPQTVSMRTILRSKIYQESKYKLPIALGSTISNDVYIADLAKMPHLLVAGATGQGKSVGLNAIITSLLYSKRPEELKFVMVDPKRVEFSLYSKIEKYYLAKIPDSEQAVITKTENVVATLSSLCVEMDERYKLLEKAFVRQLTEYNEKYRAKKLDPREGHRFMPYIVVIIDEFADLIMTAGKEVELPIARLAQLARAVGIHVIIATQRPSTNVITGMIKANFPVRMAFKVSSGVDSKTILDTTGAQHLIGRGDMLISNNGNMTRVQCAFVDTPEVEEVCDYIARQPYPQGAFLLPEPLITAEKEESLDADMLGKKDTLFDDIARQVVSSGIASTSAVQRRNGIGFARAGRIMDQLELHGIVGPVTGGKARSVLVDASTLEGILASLN